MREISDAEFHAVLRFVRARARFLGQLRPRLHNVTCFCATSVRVPRAVEVLRLCSELCEFDEVVLATHEELPFPHPVFLRVVPVPPIEDRYQYGRLILDDLKHMTRTDFVLVVQDDGFVLNPGAWDDSFRNFDYIGAPWPATLTTYPGPRTLQLANRVGNGGFSLRSRRLIEMCSMETLSRPGYNTELEDLLIGHFNYPNLVGKGIRFADIATASRFSGETPSDDGILRLGDVFGFHGKVVMEALAAEATCAAGTRSDKHLRR
jgi:hypothetical protein